MLEKQKAKRPFITELFDMFPASYQLSREVDIQNYNSLKKNAKVVEHKNAVDTGKYLIDSEFNKMKNRQLQKKNHSVFLSSKPATITHPDQKYSLSKAFNGFSNRPKKYKNTAISQLPKFRKIDTRSIVEQNTLNQNFKKKNVQSCNISRFKHHPTQQVRYPTLIRF